MSGIVVDNFAGGGGASTGIEAALGRPIDYAINHDPEAIAMHRANHPHTKHFCGSVWDVKPQEIAKGRQVELGWFSPDCTFHSKARGGKPFRDRNIARRRRGLANLIPRWAASSAAPNVICLENVQEFADWGPLLPDGRICQQRRGMLFRRWHRQLENLGYRIDMREMSACDHGAPTTRKRLFIVMRRDGGEIVFPEATHGYGRLPYATAADCIDFGLPCPSIFERSKDLVPATLARIARGIDRYVINDPNPFIISIDNQSSGAGAAWPLSAPLRTITTENRFALVSPFVVNTRNGEREGQAPRVRNIRDPLPTVTAHGSQGAVAMAFLARHYGGHENDGASLRRPMHTITTKDHHALVTAFLIAYYGNEKEGISLREPMRTVVTKDRFGLVMVRGEPHRIVDIGMRMLTPRELFRAQSFHDRYIIDHGLDEAGEVMPLTKTAQVRMCGNSVAPKVAEALVRANVVEQRGERAA